jgi:RNA-binding protein Musashi
LFQDAKKTGHRGFGFVTFFDDSVAEQVAMASHEILGQPVSFDFT